MIATHSTVLSSTYQCNNKNERSLTPKSYSLQPTTNIKHAKLKHTITVFIIIIIIIIIIRRRAWEYTFRHS